MGNRERRTLSNDVQEIRQTSAWWCEWAAANGVAADARRRGELCLNEAVANVLSHGSDKERATAIEITVEAGIDTVSMTIADDGRPFDPVAHPPAHLPRSLAEAPIGGLGVHLMRRSADQMSYCRSQGRNVVTFTFKREGRSDP